MKEELRASIHRELDTVTDRELRMALASYLVEPIRARRHNTYIEKDMDCWIIAELEGDYQIVASPDNSFGKWWVLKSDDTTIGSDGQWFDRLEDAFRVSGSCEFENPPGYEVR